MHGKSLASFRGGISFEAKRELLAHGHSEWCGCFSRSTLASGLPEINKPPRHLQLWLCTLNLSQAQTERQTFPVSPSESFATASFLLSLSLSSPLPFFGAHYLSGCCQIGIQNIWASKTNSNRRGARENKSFGSLSLRHHQEELSQKLSLMPSLP